MYLIFISLVPDAEALAMVKYILFDFDGTLVDSKDAFITIFNQLAAQQKFKPLLLEELPYLRTLTILQRAKHLNFPLYKLPFLTLKLYQLYKQQLPQLQLFKGIQEMLLQLKEKGYELVIVSSNAEDNIRAFLQENRLTKVISEVLCSSQIHGKDKIINRFLRRQKLLPKDVIYIGDELRDVLACQKSGIPMIWVSWGYDTWELVQPQAPAYVAHTPADVLSIL